LAIYGVSIVSGLAYGIDIAAHKAALKNNLQTVAVLACGLDEIYPKAHYNTVEKMLQNGGIASDYKSKTKLYPTQFAERNRIVAGLSDAIIVVDRDVFAVPGRPNDSQSVGCNRLIKMNKAALIESAKDIEYIMGWQKRTDEKSASQQVELFVELDKEEQVIFDSLDHTNSKSLDSISLETKLPISQTTAILLSLEFKGLIRSLPGKQFQRN